MCLQGANHHCHTTHSQCCNDHHARFLTWILCSHEMNTPKLIFVSSFICSTGTAKQISRLNWVFVRAFVQCTAHCHTGTQMKLSKCTSSTILYWICPWILQTCSFRSSLQRRRQKYCQNYRPILLLPTVSRLLDSVVKTHLVHFLTDHDLYPVTQFAYR